MAWKASSASGRVPKTRRQTPRTIGPCLETRAENADSSLPATNRPSNCPSGRAVAVPWPKTCSRSRATAPRCSPSMLIHRRPLFLARGVLLFPTILCDEPERRHAFSENCRLIQNDSGRSVTSETFGRAPQVGTLGEVGRHGAGLRWRRNRRRSPVFFAWPTVIHGQT